MIRHVALFRWAETATEEQKRAAVQELRALPERVPGIRNFSCGTDAGVQPGNFDLAVVADFDDADAYAGYRDHQAHQAVVKAYVRPAVAERAALQYELSPGGPE